MSHTATRLTSRNTATGGNARTPTPTNGAVFSGSISPHSLPSSVKATSNVKAAAVRNRRTLTTVGATRG